jgi:hypothetical protein
MSKALCGAKLKFAPSGAARQGHQRWPGLFYSTTLIALSLSKSSHSYAAMRSCSGTWSLSFLNEHGRRYAPMRSTGAVQCSVVGRIERDPLLWMETPHSAFSGQWRLCSRRERSGDCRVAEKREIAASLSAKSATHR